MWSVEDCLSVVTPGRGALPAISPDGELIAATVDRRLDARPAQLPHSRFALTGLPLEAARGAHLRVWQVVDGADVEPFPGWSTTWGGQWSPDGSRLAAFIHNPVGAPRLGVWRRETNVVQVLDGDAGSFFTFERPQWACNGTALVTELRPPDRSGQLAQHGEKVEAVAEPSVKVLSTADGDAARPDFAGLDVADLALIGLDGSQRILARGWVVRGWRVSPDGSRVACLRVDPGSNDDAGMSYELAVIDLADGSVGIAARGISQAYGIGWSWSPDGTRIAYLQQPAGQRDALWLADLSAASDPVLLSDGGGLWPARPRFYSEAGSYEVPRWIDDTTVLWHRAGTGYVRCSLPASDSDTWGRPGGAADVDVVASGDPSSAGEVWLVDLDTNMAGRSGSVRSAVNKADGSCEIHTIDLRSGQRSVVHACPGTVLLSPLLTGGCDRTGLSAFILDADSGTSELWIVDDHSARLVASLNPQLHWPHQSRRIDWQTAGTIAATTSRHGALFVPAGPPPTAGYPLVISVYGGSTLSRLADDWDPMNGILHTSLLTSRGFAVLFPDLPIDDNRPPMEQFAESLRPGIGRVCRELPIDTNRISAIGNSYGSYTVLSLLVTMSPDTFAAAAVTAPIVNPLASYGSLGPDGHTFLGYWETGQGRLRRPPWDDPDTWVANTPYLRLDQVTTPVLIGVGSGGIPGEQAQADQLYTGLRRLGRPAELRKYAQEDHSPATWSVPAYRDFATRCLEWLAHPPTQ